MRGNVTSRPLALKARESHFINGALEATIAVAEDAGIPEDAPVAIGLPVPKPFKPLTVKEIRQLQARIREHLPREPHLCPRCRKSGIS